MTIVAMVVVFIVSGALMLGAIWGIYGPLSRRSKGFLIALAGGALVYALIGELIEPALDQASAVIVVIALVIGALSFSGLDALIEAKWGSGSGGGLLAAITLDGVPENLALGAALIGVRSAEVAALAGSIFLSNLPEAAGGARDMVSDGRSKSSVLALWAATALLLSAAAIVGNVALESAPDVVLASTRSFAAGAVVASLAIAVFPEAYREDHHLAGVATVIGLVVAVLLGQLGAS